MPMDAAIIVTVITAAFLGFAVTLWWAERQTRSMHQE
jgi:hypothetical protein